MQSGDEVLFRIRGVPVYMGTLVLFVEDILTDFHLDLPTVSETLHA